jgi:hypothetical protein
MLASQRIESVIDFGEEDTTVNAAPVPEKRGAPPTLIEMFILSWVSGKFKSHFTSSFNIHFVTIS